MLEVDRAALKAEIARLLALHAPGTVGFNDKSVNTTMFLDSLIYAWAHVVVLDTNFEFVDDIDLKLFIEGRRIMGDIYVTNLDNVMRMVRRDWRDVNWSVEYIGASRSFVAVRGPISASGATPEIALLKLFFRYPT